MKKIITFVMSKIIGYYKKWTTGVCGTRLYYNGCNCSECIKEEESLTIELRNIIKTGFSKKK